MYQVACIVDVQAVSIQFNVNREMYRPWHNAYNRAMLANVAQRWVMFDNHPPAWLEVC
jgi:hypothetical protein